MSDKKRYYNLDDIGFVGTQEKRSPAQIKADAERTAHIINAMKKGNQNPDLTIRRNKVAKVK